MKNVFLRRPEKRLTAASSGYDPLVLFLRAIIVLVIGASIIAGSRGLAQNVRVPQLDVFSDGHGAAVISDVLPVYRPYEDYAKVMGQRDLFGALREHTDGAAATTTGTALGHWLRVKGIVYDTEPLVIVEKIADGTTAFLTRGQSFCGATVDEIRRDSVVFTYNTEKISLSP